MSVVDVRVSRRYVDVNSPRQCEQSTSMSAARVSISCPSFLGKARQVSIIIVVVIIIMLLLSQLAEPLWLDPG